MKKMKEEQIKHIEDKLKENNEDPMVATANLLNNPNPLTNNNPKQMPEKKKKKKTKEKTEKSSFL